MSPWEGRSPFKRDQEGLAEHLLPASVLYDWYRLSRLPLPPVHQVSWPQDHENADRSVRLKLLEGRPDWVCVVAWGHHPKGDGQCHKHVGNSTRTSEARSNYQRRATWVGLYETCLPGGRLAFGNQEGKVAMEAVGVVFIVICGLGIGACMIAFASRKKQPFWPTMLFVPLVVGIVLGIGLFISGQNNIPGPGPCAPASACPGNPLLQPGPIVQRFGLTGYS